MVFAPGGAGQSTLAVGLAFSLSKRTRLCAGQSAFSLRLSSLLRAKREPEKHPLLSRRGRHEKGAARPFQTPKERSKRKKASRFAKRFFLVSPTCCFAAGVTLSADGSVQQGGKIFGGAVNGRITKKCATATTAACGGYREELLGRRSAGHECRSRHEVDAGHRNPS